MARGRVAHGEPVGGFPAVLWRARRCAGHAAGLGESREHGADDGQRNAFPATRVVLKMPVAMPARSPGTTLTARPSIKPQGRLMPRPIGCQHGRAPALRLAGRARTVAPATASRRRKTSKPRL
ncbi:hypothetical protein ACU4GD_43025 [Cupriavidus basilensis]